MDNINEKKLFLEKIKGRANILRKLSLDRLKILNSYYDKEIKNNSEEISKLKQQLKRD